jgi:hypothetical protein
VTKDRPDDGKRHWSRRGSSRRWGKAVLGIRRVTTFSTSKGKVTVDNGPDHQRSTGTTEAERLRSRLGGARATVESLKLALSDTARRVARTERQFAANMFEAADHSRPGAVERRRHRGMEALKFAQAEEAESRRLLRRFQQENKENS